MTPKCHPELVSGSYQPSDSTLEWLDSEHRPIIAKQQSLTLQNDDLTCHCDSITRHPESTSRHSEAQAVPCGHPDSYGSPSACQRLKQESIVNREILQSHSFLQNDDLMCHSESLHVILSVSKDSVQKLTKCQVLNGGMLSQKQSFCVQYKN